VRLRGARPPGLGGETGRGRGPQPLAVQFAGELMELHLLHPVSLSVAGCLLAGGAAGSRVAGGQGDHHTRRPTGDPQDGAPVGRRAWGAAGSGIPTGWLVREPASAPVRVGGWLVRLTAEFSALGQAVSDCGPPGGGLVKGRWGSARPALRRACGARLLDLAWAAYRVGIIAE
jgi:hypothetical protein